MCPELPTDIHEAVRRALIEDVGHGDLTATLIPEHARLRARVVSREAAVLCGRAWFEEVFRTLSEAVTITWHAADGDAIDPGQVLCEIAGPARALLTGERTALNFLQALSGTATQAHRHAEQVTGLPVRILDTRKTLPGLRAAQKYAVACGGGHNHRKGLYDGILIKENHVHALGSVGAAVRAARERYPNLPVEVEVEDLAQLSEAVEAGAHRVLLDNFDLDGLRQAVALNAGRARLEASGGITLDNLRAVALTGVDDISVGAVTKDVRAVDLSMRFVDDEATQG